MPIRITGMNSGLDTEAIIQELTSAKSYKKTQLEKAQTKLGWKQEAWKALNTKIYDFYTKTLDSMRFESDLQKRKSVCSNSNAASVVAKDNAPNSTQTLDIYELAAAGYMTGAEMKATDGSKVTGKTTLGQIGYSGNSSFTVETGGKITTINVYENMSIEDLTQKLQGAGIGANFDEENHRLYLNANGSGKDADFTLGGDVDALKAVGLSVDDGAQKIDGTDAHIKLNRVDYYSSDNIFEINGLTITAQEKTTGATITTSVDTSGIYDMVKNFIKGYNELINEMDKLYNADSAKDYEPLTDEEKDAMSDTEVEKWETKIKDSLLRRDSTLSSVASAMKQVMAAGVTMKDGSKMYLFDFGINTLGYFTAADNEKSAYHIDGDADDSNTSSNEKTLESMIASNPDKVIEFISGLAKNMYSTLSDKMARVDGVSSAFTIYNDKTLQDEYDTYTEKIKTQQKKVDAYMDKYYEKFAAMETALATLQSKQNSVSQLLGM